MVGALAGSGSDTGGWGEFWAGLVFELASFGCGESGEFCLDAGDLGGHGDKFEAGLVGGEFGLLGGAEDPGIEEPLVRGTGLVVDACAPANSISGPSDGLGGWGEVVEPVTHHHPQLVEQVE